VTNAFIPDDARYEVKFVADATRYHEIEQWLLLNRAGFRMSYPPRQVNNAYFDTPDLMAYAENLSGTSGRAKVRLRWYGETDRPESTVLEVKRRRNHLGWKHHYPAGPLDFTARSWPELRRELRSALSQEGRLWLDAHPHTVMINRYHRQYFESTSGRLRATLDWRQRAFDQRLMARPNLRNRANLPDTLVVDPCESQFEVHGRSRIHPGAASLLTSGRLRFRHRN
jgi:hypothetical protein